MDPNPPILWRPPYIAYPPPFFQILSNTFPLSLLPPTPTPTAFFGWIGDRATFDVLVYLMTLWIYTCRALVPEGTWCVFYATRHQVYGGLTHNVVFCWYSNLISHTQTHAHTKTNNTLKGQLTYTSTLIYIYTTCYELTAAIFITLKG